MDEQSRLVSLDSIRARRTFRDLQSWIGQVFEFYFADEERRARFRLDNSQPFKKFREEVLTVAPFLERLGADENLRVMFPADNSPLDSIVYGTNNVILMQLEVVTAVDGYDNRLRMELATAVGRAPGFGSIKKDKATGRIIAHNEAVASDEPLEKLITLIDEAIINKDEKSYPPHTWLLVSFFDSALIDEAIPQLIDAIKSKGYATQFERIYLVGQSPRNRLLERVDSLANHKIGEGA